MASETHPLPLASGRVSFGTIAPWVYVAGLAILLASFPARNLDIWSHLAAGRNVVEGNWSGFSTTWLYDVLCYVLYRVGGGTLLAVVKALLVGALGVMMLRLGRAYAGPYLATGCTALALVAISQRVLLQPITVSYMFLALAVWLAERRTDSPRPAWWPGWPLVAVFVAWTNTDRWPILGVGIVALIWVGRCFDRHKTWRELAHSLAAVAVLAGACVLSPANVRALRPPKELTELYAAPTDPDAAPGSHSPLSRTYFTAFQDNPTVRAYYALLALSGLSFLPSRGNWRWEWFLPWLALAVLSAGQAQTIPLFAVVAGPVLAWNVASVIARRPVSRRVQRAAMAAVMLAGLALLVCAWPGWVQGPPYEPRRWAVEQPMALARAAALLEQWQKAGLPPTGTRTLHTSREVAGAFAWFGPGDDALADNDLIDALAHSQTGEPPREQLRAAKVARVVVPLADRGHAIPLLEHLLTAPEEWPLLHTAGGIAIFGWRDPARGDATDPFADREVNFDRLAFRPTDEEKAPSAPPAVVRRRWWGAFLRPAPSRSPDRSEARLLLLKAEAERISSPLHHAKALEGWQTATIIGGAGVGPGGIPQTLALRLLLVAPPPPVNGQLPAITVTAFDVQRRLLFARGDVAPGLLYTAIRAARRAVAADPSDAGAYLVLGQCYLRLLDSTSERAWAARMPRLAHLRQIQASAALNRAVALNPALAQAHLELALLYRRMNYGDLAVTHMRTYRELVVKTGRSPDPRASDEVMEQLNQKLDRYKQELAEKGGRASTADRAQLARKLGLAGEALRLLLQSDVSAFGTPGMRLELELLLSTGRETDLLAWATPELRGSLGDETYHWMRAQAYVATGDYLAADLEMATTTGTPLTPTAAGRVAASIAGKGVLGGRPGPGGVPVLLWQALSENDFQAESFHLEQTVANQCDLTAIRGLVALEAGDVNRARDAFREVLDFTNAGPLSGGFRIPSQSLAATGLDWLSGGDSK